MSEKYTDLTEEIWRTDEGRTSLGSVEMVLDYLDTHPDQVPGRTITESEFDELVDALHQNWATPEYFSGVLSDALIDHRIAVIPDPEPTNAEKLEDDLVDWYAKNKDARPSLADHLIERGWVKAPGGDDD